MAFVPSAALHVGRRGRALVKTANVSVSAPVCHVTGRSPLISAACRAARTRDVRAHLALHAASTLPTQSVRGLDSGNLWLKERGDVSAMMRVVERQQQVRRLAGKAGQRGGRPRVRHKRPQSSKNVAATRSKAMERWDKNIESAGGMVRLIDQHGVNRGIVSLELAIKTALSDSLNVLQVTELNADETKAENAPPVCKIMDRGQHEYKLQKQEQQQAAQARAIKRQQAVKELKFGTSIGEKDMLFKIKKCEEFLKRLNTVKLTIVFKRSKAVKPSERQGRAFEILRVAGEHLAPVGRELVEQRKVMLGSVRTVFVPGAAVKGVKPSAAAKQDADTLSALQENDKMGVDSEQSADLAKALAEEEQDLESEPEIHSIESTKQPKKTELLKEL